MVSEGHGRERFPPDRHRELEAGRPLVKHRNAIPLHAAVRGVRDWSNADLSNEFQFRISDKRTSGFSDPG